MTNFTHSKTIKLAFLLFALTSVFACATPPHITASDLPGIVHSTELDSQPIGNTETAVQIIPLAPPLNDPEAEISAMAWCENQLILVPQYPHRLSKKHKTGNHGYFYSLDRESIVDFIEGRSNVPLRAKAIRVNEGNLRSHIAFFDGYEGIACNGNSIWLTIESFNALNNYQSYLVHASFQHGADRSITIEPSRLKNLKSQSGLRNIGDEALLIDDDRVYSFHELNGQHLVTKPKAHVLELKNETQSTIDFAPVPYRITDSTDLDENARFWAINYKYSEDTFSDGVEDALSKRYGRGASHQKFRNVERLLEFEIKENLIELVEREPMQLLMTESEGRNWEGIARLGERGLLLVTDKHPATIFAFVPFKSTAQK